MDVIGNSGIPYCTIPENDRAGEPCNKCPLKKLGAMESLANEINRLHGRVFEWQRVQKENINSAIRDIDGLLYDFGEAVSSLRNIKELLYSFTETEDLENEKIDG